MKINIYPATQRGRADYGWLKTHYSFSFANYYNPENIHFGALRVLNDDNIQPGMGFGTHPHDNMEIITIPLKGELLHQDSMGHQSVISTGEVQVMSAGTGIQHSEYNASDKEWLSLFQIWIFPDQQGLTPRYDQKKFELKTGEPLLLVSPDGREGSLTISQNAFLSRIQLERNTNFNYHVYDKQNGLFLMLIEGTANIAGKTLLKRDVITVEEMSQLAVHADENMDLLILEVPVYD